MRHSTRWLAGLLLSTAIAHGWQQPQRPKTPPAKPQSDLERAVEEFKVLTRDLGLRPNEPGKRVRGTSTGPGWHGRIFENFRNDKLDATPHEVVQRGGSRNLLRRNQFGFNVGGPVVIPKLYDGSREDLFQYLVRGRAGTDWPLFFADGGDSGGTGRRFLPYVG